MKNASKLSPRPLLSAICAMRGHEIYELVSRLELLRAMQYYRAGRVLSFAWYDQGARLCALVKGRREYEVELVQDRSGLRCHCDCPAFGNYSSTCKHTVAVLTTICHVLDPSRFRPSPFSDAIREGLAGQLLAEQEPAPGPQDPEPFALTLHRGWGEEYTLYGDTWGEAWYGSREPQWVPALYAASGKRRDELLLDMMGDPKREARWLVALDEGPCEVGGVCEEAYKWKVVLDAGDDAVTVRLFLDGPEGTYGHDFVRCSSHLAFLPAEKRLARVTRSGPMRAYLNLWRSVRDDGGGDYGDEAFSVERPVQIPYRATGEEVGSLLSDLASKPGVRLLVRGRPTRLKTVAPVLSVQIESDRARGEHELRIASEVDGVELGWHEAVDVLEARKYSYEYPSALTRAQARRRALRDAEEGIYAAVNREQTREAVRAVARQELFTRVRCQRAAQSYLNHVARSVHTKSPRIHGFAGTEGPRWVRVRRALLPVARLKALARRVFDVEDDAQAGGRMAVGNRELARGVAAFAAVCKEQEVSLRYNRAPLKTTGLDISVQVQRGPDIDWFELRPEVAAEGLQVAQSKWEQLIRGDMLEQADGSFLVIDLDSTEALRRVQTLLRQSATKTKGRKAVPQVPRLRIFDWLDLERAGVRLDLPKEDRGVLKSLHRFAGTKKVSGLTTLKASLRAYQQEGLDWLAFLYRHRFGACLADDMGLGKTLQAIALLAAVGEKRIPGLPKRSGRLPHLVVVPPSLLYNWQHELERFCPDLRVVEYTGPKRKLALKSGDVMITTYELVRRDIERLAKQAFDIAIFDETQQVKNEAARRSRAAQQLQARFRLCLTGTPLENHIGEYFNIMELALPGLLEDARPFAKALGSEDEERYVRRTRPFILRRTKSEVLKDLPAKQEADAYLDMSANQKELYTRTVAEVREQVLEAYEDKTAAQAGIVALSALTRLRQICVSPALLDPDAPELAPKLLYLRAKLSELTEEGHAALVFSQFTRALDLIEPVLEEAGVAFTRLDGKTTLARRKKRVAAFQQADGPPVFLVSLKAGGVGLNLTRATYVFHVDPWWNPAVETQATDRAHRIGQRRKVMVNRVLMHHTIEEKLMVLKEAKQALFNRVMASKVKGGRRAHLSREDFDFLLT